MIRSLSPMTRIAVESIETISSASLCSSRSSSRSSGVCSLRSSRRSEHIPMRTSGRSFPRSRPAPATSSPGSGRISSNSPRFTTVPPSSSSHNAKGVACMVKDVYAEKLISATDRMNFLTIASALIGVSFSGVSCHHVALALSHLFPSMVKAEHGRFAQTWEHSWLRTPDGNIIDAYPVGCIGGPLLLDGHAGPATILYKVTGENAKPDPSPLAELVLQIQERMI